jgi:hypothetical protein
MNCLYHAYNYVIIGIFQKTNLLQITKNSSQTDPKTPITKQSIIKLIRCVR